jgi:hypothetical protein
MEIRHQLPPKLKSLRLSGILETLDVRTQQAITEQLSYVEFLQRRGRTPHAEAAGAA